MYLYCIFRFEFELNESHSHHQRSKDIMECYCPHNSVIEEWGVIAVHLMKSYSFADGFHVNIYITSQGKILCKSHK